ncbi:hypothetical protein JST97_01580 [bacterium]|nr:hypothetical protein [bacterium]
MTGTSEELKQAWIKAWVAYGFGDYEVAGKRFHFWLQRFNTERTALSPYWSPRQQTNCEQLLAEIARHIKPSRGRSTPLAEQQRLNSAFWAGRHLMVMLSRQERTMEGALPVVKPSPSGERLTTTSATVTVPNRPAAAVAAAPARPARAAAPAPAKPTASPARPAASKPTPPPAPAKPAPPPAPAKAAPPPPPPPAPPEPEVVIPATPAAPPPAEVSSAPAVAASAAADADLNLEMSDELGDLNLDDLDLSDLDTSDMDLGDLDLDEASLEDMDLGDLDMEGLEGLDDLDLDANLEDLDLGE